MASAKKMQSWIDFNNMAVNLYVNNYYCTLLYILELSANFALTNIKRYGTIHN